MKKLTIVLLTLLTACGQNYTSESQSDEDNHNLIQSEEINNETKFQLINQNILLPPVKGDIVSQQSWIDNNGKWHCLLTELIDVPNEFAEFRLYKFKENSIGKFIEYFVYRDSISCGEADIVAESNTKELIVTDVDENDIAEVTFAYTLSCTYDVSPQRRILIVNIDSSLHKLVGFTLDFDSLIPDSNDLSLENYEKDEDDYWYPPITAGRYENEIDFKQLPSTFLTHAKNTWLSILKVEHDFKQKKMNE